MRIIVTRRTADYHVCLEGHSELWGCGTSIVEAIGQLVLAHSERFNIHIAAQV